MNYQDYLNLSDDQKADFVLSKLENSEKFQVRVIDRDIICLTENGYENTNNDCCVFSVKIPIEGSDLSAYVDTNLPFAVQIYEKNDEVCINEIRNNKNYVGNVKNINGLPVKIFFTAELMFYLLVLGSTSNNDCFFSRFVVTSPIASFNAIWGGMA